MTVGIEVVVVGRGERSGALAARLAEAGVAARAEPGVSAALDDDVDCVVVSTGVDDPLAAVERVDRPVVVVAGEGGPAPAAALAAGADEFVPAATAAEAIELLVRRVEAAVGAPDAESTADGEAPPVREALDALDEAVWLLRDGAVAYANPACAELLDRSREDLVGTPVTELAAPSDRERLAEHVEALAAGDAERRVDEVTVSGVLGERITVEVRGRRLGEATLGRLVAVAERADERRVDALFEHLASPAADVVLSDARATVRRANPAFAGTFGVDGDAVGEDLVDLVVPADDGHEERALELYHRVERGEAVAEEVTRATVDGQRELQLRALPYGVGRERRALLVYVDAAERVERAERLEALHAATRELLAAADRAAVAAVGAESAGDLLDGRPAVLYEFDADEDALVPTAATDGARVDIDDLSPVPRGGGPTWYAYEMGDPVVVDDTEARGDREPDRPTRSELLVPLGEHGLLVACAAEPGAFGEADEALARTLGSTLAAAFDRAEREELLREREAELRRQNERLEEFAGIVSHDLRGPLTVITGNAALLRDKGDVKYLDRIEDAADRMDALIDDLLDLARQGETVDDPELVALDDLVAEAWATADTRDATLAADVDASVAADPGRLRQLFENLFNNAAAHGGADVTVRVGTVEASGDERRGGRYGDDLAGFYVADDGPGLPEADRDELFDPGVTTDDDGTGFGLAIVQRVAEAHGWEVTADESDAGGARFEFTGLGE